MTACHSLVEPLIPGGSHPALQPFWSPAMQQLYSPHVVWTSIFTTTVHSIHSSRKDSQVVKLNIKGFTYKTTIIKRQKSRKFIILSLCCSPFPLPPPSLLLPLSTSSSYLLIKFGTTAPNTTLPGFLLWHKHALSLLCTTILSDFVVFASLLSNL